MARTHGVIREISMRNLLSFGDEGTRLMLGPLTVLIGPNGCGKSNLLEVFYLLSRLPASGPDVSLPIVDWIWKGATDDSVGSVKAIIDIPSGHTRVAHHIAFFALSQRFTVKEERVDQEGPSGSRQLRHREGPDNQSILAQVYGLHDHDEGVVDLRQTYEGIRVYRSIRFGPGSPTRQPQRTDLPTRALLEDGSNLGLILNRLNANVATQRRLVELLKRFYPPAERVDVQVQGGTVQIYVTESNWITPATRLSDGTMQWLTLLAILLDPEPPKVVCLDEPDLGLHPDMMPALADLLVEASERMQVVVTTHSDALVDAFTDRPECVVVCEKDEGKTTLRRLEVDALKAWLKDYSLGELWNSGQIGGRRF